ncbi:MAG: hypothetical protein ABIG95_04995 [Candidatus Woesearchaeota archaeon]
MGGHELIVGFDRQGERRSENVICAYNAATLEQIAAQPCIPKTQHLWESSCGSRYLVAGAYWKMQFLYVLSLPNLELIVEPNAKEILQPGQRIGDLRVAGDFAVMRFNHPNQLRVYSLPEFQLFGRDDNFEGGLASAQGDLLVTVHSSEEHYDNPLRFYRIPSLELIGEKDDWSQEAQFVFTVGQSKNQIVVTSLNTVRAPRKYLRIYGKKSLKPTHRLIGLPRNTRGSPIVVGNTLYSIESTEESGRLYREPQIVVVAQGLSTLEQRAESEPNSQFEPAWVDLIAVSQTTLLARVEENKVAVYSPQDLSYRGILEIDRAQLIQTD